MNALSGLAMMAPEDCIYCNNLMPVEYGLRLRKGYREWAINIPGDEVNTIIPFEGQGSSVANDRLFAVTPLGIYNVTRFGEDAPAQMVSFADQSQPAGFGVWTEFTNDSTNRFLYYSDGRNGLHEYAESTDTWSVPVFNGPGFNVTNVAFVTSWKNRLWFVQEESGDAYYTDVDAVGGQVKKFTFGSKFQHGGDLKALYSWTIDGGDGIDDLLIAISRGGDVLIYKGIDPELAPDAPGGFSLVGSYFLGEVPESRRLGVDYGGELYLLSTFGITSIRDLLQGVVPDDAGKSPSSKISRYIRAELNAGKDELNWSMHIHPADGFLQVVTPYTTRKDAVQYTQNLLTRAWGMWRGVPTNCAETWNANYYMGDRQGRVYIYDGALDDTKLPGPEMNTGTILATGTGWTDAGGGAYNCDGTQTAESDLVLEISPPTVFNKRYTIQFRVENYVSGSVRIYLGNKAAFTTAASNNARIVSTIVSDGVGDTEIRIRASDDFVGTVSGVEVSLAAEQGSPINFDLLTSFQAPGGDGTTFKRVGFIRTMGVLQGLANISTNPIYDYQIGEEITAPPDIPPDAGNTWDNSVWDSDMWDFAQRAVSIPQGASGMGRVVAVAMRGSTNTRLNVVGFDVSYTTGGFL